MSLFGSLRDAFGHLIGVQYPLSTDGDSVYVKDIDTDRITKDGWTGEVIDLFDCPNTDSGVYNDTITNPKVLFIPFCRTVYLNAVGLGCHIAGKTFSNVKMEFIGSDGTVRYTFDDSTNNTKYGTKLYSFVPTACTGIRISFLTANTDVGLTNITIQKEGTVVSRIRALKPDGTIADIDATVGGNLKTAISDNYGFDVENTPMDELRTITPVKLIGTNFEGTTTDTNFWTITPVNNGTTTQSGNQIILSTGTTTSGAVSLQSVRFARYVGGSSNRFRSVIRLGDTGVVNNSRKWGMFNGTDGAYFELDGTTLYIVTLNASTPTRVAIANWNVDTVAPTLTNANTYEIYITNSGVYFVIDSILKHIVYADTTPWASHISLPAKISNTNTGINTNQTIECRVMTIYRLGNLETQPTAKYQSGTTAGIVCKYSTGNLRGIIISGVVNNAVVTLYDNTAASGTIIWSSGTMSNQTVPFDLDFKSIPFAIGLTMVISGANCNVLVMYE